MQQPTNNQSINPQSITTEQQQNMSKLQETNNPYANIKIPTINRQPSINELLTDPKHQATRDSEILKTFELAKLTRDEAILVLDKINGHQGLQQALEKLKPHIRT